MKNNDGLIRIILIILFISLFLFFPILGRSLEILSDDDRDGISDGLEKYAGLDPGKDECEPTRCSVFYGDEYLVVILDLSESISEKKDNDSRIEIAGRVFADFIDKFPSAAAGFGFYVYGINKTATNEGLEDTTGCKSFVELQSPSQKLNRKELKENLGKVQAGRGKPLAYSLIKFRESILDKKGKFNLVLITDGNDNCNGNVIEEAKKLDMLNSRTLAIKLSVVGFGVDEKNAEELKKIAIGSGGIYLATTSGEELEEFIQRPVKDIIASFQGLLCLHKQIDKLLLCEQSRNNKLRAAFNRLNSSESSPFTEDEKKTIVGYYPKTERYIQERINLYAKIKKDGTESYSKKIDELSKLILAPADKIKKKK